MNSNLSAFYRGDTKAMNLVFTGASGPVDLSNHEIWFSMKTSPADTDENAIIQKRITLGSNEQTTRGSCVLTLTSAETKMIPPGTYYYDIQHVIPENPPIVASFSGRVVVLADITRSDGA